MIRNKLKVRALILSLCLSFLCVMEAFAEAEWESRTFSHFSQNEPLTALLQSFASGLGIPIQLSAKVAERKDVVSAKFERLDAVKFLADMASLYRITWYFDGSLLYIYDSDEVRSEVVKLNYLNAGRLRQILEQLGVYDSRFQWRTMQSSQILFVSGPPRYVELVLSIAQLHDQSAHELSTSDFKAKIFPLKHAWAGDRTISFREHTVVIPGVATTLKRILGGDRGGSPPPPQQQPQQKNKAQQGAPLQGLAGNDQKPTLDTSYQTSLPNQSTTALNMPNGAYIEANTFQNSVIVYDLSSRMPMYAELVQGLDIPMEQLEIEVSIMDVNTTRLSDLGVDWRYKKGNGSVDFGNTGGLPDATVAGGAINFGDVLNPNAVLARGGDHLLGRVRLLSQEGDGQVLSQPKVLTMNNVEAVIDNSSTFYVKLEGKEDVDLVPITVGTILRVSPRIVNDRGGRKISLDVIIEDGQVDDSAEKRVDNLPRVNKTTINTQAVINENDSLLVGGYFYDAQTNTGSKVPFLGDAPINFVRKLFSSEQKNRRKIARLFMITPKIIADSRNSQPQNIQRVKKRVDEAKSFDELDYHKSSPVLFD